MPSEKSNNYPLQKITKFAYLHSLQLQVVGSHCLIWLMNFLMSSAQYVVNTEVLVVFLDVALLFRYSAALLMFHFSVVFRLLCQCSVVPSVFWCSAGVLPVFRVLQFYVPVFLVLVWWAPVSLQGRPVVSVQSSTQFWLVVLTQFCGFLLGKMHRFFSWKWETIKV